MRRDRLVLTVPPDPAYARLARLLAVHLLRLQGVKGAPASASARAVEIGSRAALQRARRAAADGARRPRSARPAGGGPRAAAKAAARPVAITVVCSSGAVQVTLAQGRTRRRIVSRRAPGRGR